MVIKLNKKVIQFLTIIVCIFSLSFNLVQNVFAESLVPPISNSISIYNLDGTGSVSDLNNVNFWTWYTLGGTGNNEDNGSGFTNMCFSTPSSVSGKTADGNVHFNFDFNINVTRLAGFGWTPYSSNIVGADAPFQVTYDDVSSTVMESDNVTDAGSYYVSYNHKVSGYITSGATIPSNLCFYGVLLNVNNNRQFNFNISQGKLSFYYDQSSETMAIDEQTQQQQEHYEEQQNQAEQQGQDAQDNSDETQSQVDNKTQNLFSFITSFFGAFTSASPSNCNFDWGLADKGFGIINMCETNIPAELQSILSIVSILIVVPMVLWLINSIVGAFKEFQQ